MEPPSHPDQGQTSPKTPPSASSSSCSSASHHSSTICHNCGGATSFPPPPQSSPISPPLAYIPIRAPSHYLPPNHNPQQTIMLTPVPQSLPVVPVSLPHTFQVPEKRIHSPDDIIHFHSSSAFKHFLGFIVSLSESIRCHKISDPCHQSSLTNTLVSTLQTMITWIDEIPPVPQSSRYGNYAYRDWQDRLNGNVESIMMNILLIDELKPAVIELAPYLLDSFGNASRIDYGTGHEANFVAFLYCLARIGLVKAEDYQAMVSRVFVKYLELMRKLQLVYFLEPAGSHGVWGLDDYHFLPFIFGSSQLIDHKYMKPKSIHNDDIVDNFSNEYMYLSGIAFVKKVKKGPFAEHSPMLDDISGVPNWNKVNSGMLKMYKVEVLEKVPIMQHFLFGSLIPWEEKAK